MFQRIAWATFAARALTTGSTDPSAASSSGGSNASALSRFSAVALGGV
jgi:hypothetical protein